MPCAYQCTMRSYLLLQQPNCTNFSSNFLKINPVSEIQPAEFDLPRFFHTSVFKSETKKARSHSQWVYYLHIPYISRIVPLSSKLSFSADLKYVQSHTTYPLILYQVMWYCNVLGSENPSVFFLCLIYSVLFTTLLNFFILCICRPSSLEYLCRKWAITANHVMAWVLSSIPYSA